MKLGKRERALRRERMRYAQQCRERANSVFGPGNCSGKTRLCTDNLSPSASARPRVPAGWNSTSARVRSHRLGTVYR
jgi:hypothetical protein